MAWAWECDCVGARQAARPQRPGLEVGGPGCGGEVGGWPGLGSVTVWERDKRPDLNALASRWVVLGVVGRWVGGLGLGV